MHITDGALSTPVLIAGGVLAVGGIAIGLRKVKVENIPAAGVLSATFFVASLIHVPIGPTSVHLIMNGLAGAMLGWLAFPALFIGLLLQAVFFGFGGVTVLGVNTVDIALPAVIMFYVCRRGIRSPNLNVATVWGAVAGAGAIVLTTVFVGIALGLSGDEFIPSAWTAFLAHIPVMIIEGFVCAAAVYLIRRTRPEFFTTLARSA